MQLSKIKTTDILFRLNDADISHVVYDIGYKEVTGHADIGFVFGGVSMIPYRIKEAINLYEQGLIDRILVSGGIGYLNIDRKTPEGIKMQKYLIEHGVPEEDIIVECESKDSIENIVNAMKIIGDDYNIDKTRFVLISSDFHIRRCIGLFTTLVGDNGLQARTAYDGQYDMYSWVNTLSGRRQIITEAILLANYARNNKIPDYEIEDVSLSRKKR